jgi:hypothetical protein
VDDFLSRAFSHQGVVALVIAPLLLLVAEAGYRLGRRLYGSGDDARRGQIGGVQAAVLGLLGLLLGFTFSMAVERDDSRRGLVLSEANAIRTVWLRASLLPDAHRRGVKDLLQDYLGVRLNSRAALRDTAVMTEGLRRSAEIQSALWRHAEAAATEAPNDMTATFVEGLNDMIDVDAERLASSRSRIPAGVWIILAVVAAVGCCTSAYAAGASGVRSPLTNVLLPLLISAVILLIFDLTSERHGIIEVSLQPLIDVQRFIR